MDDAIQALMMAFSVIVFVVGLSLAMYLFHQVIATSENIALYSDSTRYYDNIKLDIDETTTDEEIKNGLVRIVSAETIVPTLYRYYKENFCVKIYGTDGNLIQLFDVNTEGSVGDAVKNTAASRTSVEEKNKRDYSYQMLYNDPSLKGYYLYGVPWLGSTESVKDRVDYFVNGKAGYINDVYVDYTDNAFFKARESSSNGNTIRFKEKFISYSYDGSTVTSEDGDTLVTGAKSKDKIVIIYTQIN